jgi:hypothetical protein
LGLRKDNVNESKIGSRRRRKVGKMRKARRATKRIWKG